MSSSNNAYSSDEEDLSILENGILERNIIDVIKKKLVMDSIDITQLNDSMIALTYVIAELEQKKAHSIVVALKDILEIHYNTKNLLNRSTQDSKDEYESIVYSYFAMKYFEKIKLDKYKEDVRKKINT